MGEGLKSCNEIVKGVKGIAVGVATQKTSHRQGRDIIYNQAFNSQDSWHLHHVMQYDY